jgi:hypothetical protein
MRVTRYCVVVLVTSLISTSSRADEGPGPGPSIPRPDFNRIDYQRPQDYLGLEESLGTLERIRRLAATLKADRPERSLMAIGKWIETNLACDNDAAYVWRDFGRIVDSKVYGGCADHSVIFGSLARACGIPTVWVKTMDADWIREFRQSGTCTSWRGHVFLEVYIRGRWKLLDAVALVLYDEYNPAQRILPGERYAYDKGGDPRALVLSTDWERWKEQTAAYFADFDLSRLPVGHGRALGTVYVVANSPVWQAIDRRVRSLGYRCKSFNTGYEKLLPEARGGDLIVTCVGDRPVLPARYHAEYLPINLDELRKHVQRDRKGILRKRLDDGTRVTLVYAADIASLLEVVEGLDLNDEVRMP